MHYTWSRFRLVLILGTLVLVVALWARCVASILLAPPASQEAAQEEIVAAMLSQIGCSRDAIIIWGSLRSDSTSHVDSTRPIRVWWCSNGTLTERQDMLEAIAEFGRRKMPVVDHAYSMDYFEFNILSIGANRQEATVYLGSAHGPLWGQGRRLTLRRIVPGRWWIIGAEMLWIS